jgi:hypothetical protein
MPADDLGQQVARETNFRTAIVHLIGRLILPKEIPVEVKFGGVACLLLALFASFVVVLYVGNLAAALRNSAPAPSVMPFLLFYAGCVLLIALILALVIWCVHESRKKPRGWQAYSPPEA